MASDRQSDLDFHRAVYAAARARVERSAEEGRLFGRVVDVLERQYRMDSAAAQDHAERAVNAKAAYIREGDERVAENRRIAARYGYGQQPSPVRVA